MHFLYFLGPVFTGHSKFVRNRGGSASIYFSKMEDIGKPKKQKVIKKAEIMEDKLVKQG